MSKTLSVALALCGVLAFQQLVVVNPATEPRKISGELRGPKPWLDLAVAKIKTAVPELARFLNTAK